MLLYCLIDKIVCHKNEESVCIYACANMDMQMHKGGGQGFRHAAYHAFCILYGWTLQIRFVPKANLLIYFLQVLDNLPHDLLYSENQVSPWMEVWVEKQRDRYKVCRHPEISLNSFLQLIYLCFTHDDMVLNCFIIFQAETQHRKRSSGISQLEDSW